MAAARLTNVGAVAYFSRYIGSIYRTRSGDQLLELAVLGLLKEQQLHGYELKKRLTEALGPFSSVSFGSLYPALNRLETAGALRAVEAPDTGTGVAETFRPAVPMTGSIAGEAAAFRARRAAAAASRRGEPRSARTRKVYAITDRGQALFDELLEAETVGDDDRAFNLKLAFCRFLPPDRRLRLLERRRAQLEDRLDRTRNSMRGRRDRMDTYTQSLIDHGTEAAELDISWLDRLIAIERQAKAAGQANAAQANGARVQGGQQ
jgi:DNA-binding PadR family transcriptional regulator